MINRVTVVELLSHVWLIHIWKHKPVRPVGSQTSVLASVHLVAKEPGGWDGWLIYENIWYLKSQMSPSIFYVYVCSTHAHTCIYIYIYCFPYMIFLPTNPQNIIGIQWAPQQRWRYPHHFSSHQLDKLDWLNPDWSRGVTFRFNPFNWRSPLHPCFPNPVKQ